MADLVTGPFPAHFEQGTWPRSAMLTTPWTITWTPAVASDSFSDWHPLLVTNTVGGFWFENNTFSIHDSSTDDLISDAATLTWSAEQPITFKFDIAEGTYTVSGATTGNGTYSLNNEGVVLADSYLRVGYYSPPDGLLLGGTLSDITTVEEEEEPEPIDVEAPLVESLSVIHDHTVVVIAPEQVIEAPLVESISTTLPASFFIEGIIIPGPFPRTIGQGLWPRDLMLSTPFSITWIPSVASDDVISNGWRPIFVTAEIGGVWLDGRTFGVYDTNTDELLMNDTVELVWSSEQPITFTFDLVNGFVTISGATEGDGVYELLEGSVLADNALRVGYVEPEVQVLEGTLSDVVYANYIVGAPLVESRSAIPEITILAHAVVQAPLVESRSLILDHAVLAHGGIIAPLVESRSVIPEHTVLLHQAIEAPIVESISQILEHVVSVESAESGVIEAPLVVSRSVIPETTIGRWRTLVEGTFPGVLNNGEWPREQMLSSRWGIKWTPDYSSAEAPATWRPLFVTSGIGGFWFFRNEFGIYDVNTDSLLLSDEVAIEWDSGQTIDFIFDMIENKLFIYGANSGNGAYDIGEGLIFANNSALRVGHFGASTEDQALGGSFSDILHVVVPYTQVIEAPLVESRSVIPPASLWGVTQTIEAPLVTSRSVIPPMQVFGGVPLIIGKLGTNLEVFVDWSQTNWVTLNLFKGARNPISAGSNGDWDTGQPLDLDENWYPKSLQPGQWVRYLILVGGNTSHRPGDYVLSWEGKGTFTLTEVTIVDNSTPGRWIINIPAELPYEGIWFTITSLPDPEDYIRNISIKPIELEHHPSSFHPDYVDYLKKHQYACLRYMDFMKTNNNPTETWADRITPDHSTWTLETGMPIEVLIELANEAGINPWFCIPHMADDDYIQRFAEMVRDNLDPSLVAYFEYSNECWNWNFDQTHYMEAMAQANPERYNGAFADFYFIRMAEMFDIVSSVFGEETHRYKRVACWQVAWWDFMHWNVFGDGGRPNGPEDCMLKVDCFGIASYFGGYFGYPDPEWRAEVAGYTLDHFLDLVETDALDEALRETLSYVEGLDYFGHGHIEVVGYEGGNHMSTGGDNDTPEAQAVNALFDAAQDHPRMYDIYWKYLTDWQESTNNGLFNHYYDVGEKSVYGRWGARDRFDDPIDETKPKALALFRYGTGLANWPSSDTGQSITVYSPVQLGVQVHEPEVTVEAPPGAIVVTSPVTLIAEVHPAEVRMDIPVTLEQPISLVAEVRPPEVMVLEPEEILITPVGLAIGVSIGAPEVTTEIEIRPVGISNVVSIGAPAVYDGDVFPIGLSCTVFLGVPTLEAEHAPGDMNALLLSGDSTLSPGINVREVRKNLPSFK